MKLIYALLIIVLLMGCCPKPPISTNQEQLILEVPEELLESPKALQQL